MMWLSYINEFVTLDKKFFTILVAKIFAISLLTLDTFDLQLYMTSTFLTTLEIRPQFLYTLWSAMCRT